MSSDLRNRIVIRTPEGISFSYETAGPLIRFLAWSLDLACILALASLVGSVIRVFALIDLDLGLALSSLAAFVILMGYGMALEWLWRGQTLGKRMFRIRVMDEQGLHLRVQQVVIRNLLRAVDQLPVFYAVGGAVCLFSSRSRRLGDIAAGTVVVRIPHIRIPDLSRATGGKYNSLREHPLYTARLRREIRADEAGTGLRAVLRRNRLDPDARVFLFHQIADFYRELVPPPENAATGTSDEQFVINVIDVLFTPRSAGMETRTVDSSSTRKSREIE